MKINTKHDIGDIVYLKTDIDVLPRIITGIQIRKSGFVYLLAQETQETAHYDFEILTESEKNKINYN